MVTREGNLKKLKPSKCCLLHKRVPYLGHYVMCDGVEFDPMKIAAVPDWPTPDTDKGLLGLASYYRHYIPNSVSVAAP